MSTITRLLDQSVIYRTHLTDQMEAALDNLGPSDAIKAVRSLLGQGADPNGITRNGESMVVRAAKRAQIYAAKLLLVHGGRINLDPYFAEPLKKAIVNGDREHLSCILAFSPRPGESLMENAARTGNYHTDYSLVQIPKEMRIIQAAFEEACKIGDIKAIESSLKKGAIPKEDTFLLEAARKKNLPLVQLLVKFGANINAVDGNGCTIFDLLKAGYMVCSDLLKLSALCRKMNSLDRGMASFFLTYKKPAIGVVQVFDEKTGKFSEELSQVVQKTTRNGIVFFCAAYDDDPNDVGFGAITQFYERRSLIQQLSQNFIVFRVRVGHIDQLPSSIAKIKNSLSPRQEIVHLTIHAHASSSCMSLERDNFPGSLITFDQPSREAMQETFASCSPHATVVLWGCNTAKDETRNITQYLSMVAQGRIVFGSIEKPTDACYKTISFKGKLLLVASFKNLRCYYNGVAAYRNGEEILRGSFPLSISERIDGFIASKL